MLVRILLMPGDASTSAATLLQQNESVEWRIEHIAGLKVEEVRRLLDLLKQRVAKDDRSGVCSLANYPLRIRKSFVPSAADCVSGYKSIFNAKVVAAIGEQRFESLFVNFQGVMIGDTGEVWMDGVCRDQDCRQYDLRIVTVNN